MYLCDSFYKLFLDHCSYRRLCPKSFLTTQTTKRLVPEGNLFGTEILENMRCWDDIEIFGSYLLPASEIPSETITALQFRLMRGVRLNWG